MFPSMIDKEYITGDTIVSPVWPKRYFCRFVVDEQQQVLCRV